MLNIYVCEDNAAHRKLIVETIKKFILMHDYDLRFVMATHDPLVLLDNIEEGTTGIYFLDIDLKHDINGLFLAQKIRKIDKRGFVVFVSSHSEMSYMSFQYKVEALDFILKDNIEQAQNQIRGCIENAYTKYSSPQNFKHKVFKYFVGDKEYCVSFSEIIFIETAPIPHHLILHTTNGQHEFSGTLKACASSLDERFALVHCSYLINKDYLKEIDTKKRLVTMTDGSICYASAKRLKDLF